MTYRDLADRIAKLPLNRMNDTASIALTGSGEVYAVEAFGPIEIIDQQGDMSDVLDDGHYVLEIKA